MYVCTDVRRYVCTCVYAFLYVLLYVCMYGRTDVRICIYVCVCTYVRTYIAINQFSFDVNVIHMSASIHLNNRIHYRYLSQTVIDRKI